MYQLIESRLQDHRGQLQHLQSCVDQQLSMDLRQRNGFVLRFLHSQINMHELVIEELELLLAQSRRGGV